jgi:hypothetical protein
MIDWAAEKKSFFPSSPAGARTTRPTAVAPSPRSPIGSTRRFPPAQAQPGLHTQRGHRPAVRPGHPARQRAGSPQRSGSGRPRVVATRAGRAPGHLRGHPRFLGPPRLGRATGYLHPPGSATRGPRRPHRGRTPTGATPHAPRPTQPPPLAENQAVLMHEEGTDDADPRL